MAVPVVDLESVNIFKLPSELDKDGLVTVGKKIVDFLTEVGFLQIINHGIPKGIISEAMNKSESFFNSPLDNKLKCLRETAGILGYSPTPEVAETIESLRLEHFDKDKLLDAKETLHYAEHVEDKVSPNSFVPGFKATMDNLLIHEHDLHRRMMLLIGYGLELDDPEIFVKSLKRLGTPINETVLRLANYPPLPEVLANQDRCAVHTDFGTLTFIFQNSIPGLEIQTRSGKYVGVNPTTDAILVNVGDMLQRWTGNILRSAPHKVTVDEESRKSGRLSVIYFGISDAAFSLAAVTGDRSGNFSEPINAKDFLKMRYEDIFYKSKGLLDEEEGKK